MIYLSLALGLWGILAWDAFRRHLRGVTVKLVDAEVLRLREGIVQAHSDLQSLKERVGVIESRAALGQNFRK